jgi:ATP-binding cassette, subfamily B, bacterial
MRLTMLKSRGKQRLFRIITGHLRSESWQLAMAVFCVLGVVATQVAAPWPIKIIIDNILLDKPLPSFLPLLANLVETNKSAAVATVSLAIFAIVLLRGLFSYSQIYVTSRIGYQVVHRLRLELFAHLQRLPLLFHKNTRTGELVGKINADTAVLKDASSDAILMFTTQVLTLLSMLTVMCLMSWQLGVIVFATLPVLTAALLYQYRNVRKSSQQQRRRQGQISSRLNELLAAAPLVQAFGRSEYETRRFETDNAGALDDSIQAVRMEATATRLVELISAVGTSAVIFVGAMQVLDGRLTPGDLLIFSSYLSGLYRPIRSMAKLSTKFSKAAVGAERIAEILDVEPDIRDIPGAIPAHRLSGAIEFRQVSFAYKPGKPALSDVSCQIEAGRLTALVGASGAGKSTFISLLLRLYDPQTGAIVLDGHDITHYQIESLRHHIAIVQQDSMLMGTSIRDNIAYGKLDATEDEIIASAKLAMAHDFIEQLEAGYETVIGERGGTLSGGEQRRIAIARAIIRNAPILILDEPMAGLDAASEAQVREALAHLTAGKTCLLITHDLRAADEATHVLVFDHGRIVEQGHPRTLRTNGLIYARLHETTSRPSHLSRSGQA